MRIAPSLAALTVGVVLAGVLAAPLSASAAEEPIDLGTATNYSVLAGASISNQGYSVIPGNVGSGSAISGMPEASVTGVVHRNDGPALAALADAKSAYEAASHLPRSGGTVDGDLGGETLAPGTYYSPNPQTITDTLTFDAGNDPNAVFIVQVDAPLTTMASTTMVLAHGAKASQIYWQVLGDATIGASSTFIGTILTASVVNLGAGSTVIGRALAINAAATLNTTTFQSVWSTPQPTLAIDGGAARTSAAASFVISGTTTSEVGHTVVVSLGSYRYSALVGATGAWTIAVDGLRNGSYPVVATVSDPGGTANAQQQLTVAVPAAPVVAPPVPAPVITITGGTKLFTKDRTPKVSGKSTGAAGSIVVVKLGSKSKKAKVSAKGTWTVVFGKVPYRTYSLSVKSAGAVTAKQKLVVRKALPPKITISGGAADSTDDRTPTISGRTNAKVGTTVTVTLAGKTRTTSVRPGKVWKVTFGTLPLGTRNAVVAIRNSAGKNTATQKVTIGSTPTTVVPDVWTVDYLDQVVQGTTDAPVGTTVTVTVGILLFNTQVQPGGLWGVRLNQQPVGTHTVAISAGGVTTSVTLVVASGASAVVYAGCASVSPNRTAIVSFGGYRLTASVQQFGVWNIAPGSASDCDFIIVPSVIDETASTGIYSRTPISARSTPVVSINGGDHATADPSIRDISGTTTAAVGSLVRMRMASQTIETRVTPQGTWSFYRNDFAPGLGQLVVSVIDPTAGTGYAAQLLTIG